MNHQKSYERQDIYNPEEVKNLSEAYREILINVHEDPDREGLQETPARVARAYREIFAGLTMDARDVLTTTFDLGHEEMVLVKDIEVYSTCEHPLVPFHGVAHVGYIPNVDGRITNQYVVRRRSDGRWLVLPWDYDKTFLSGKNRDVYLSNSLYERCRRLVPGFRDRLAARWTELRAGPLSDEALDRWIDEKSSFLAPFMDEDFRLVPPTDFAGTYPEAVEALRGEVRYRLRRGDRLFAPPSAR